MKESERLKLYKDLVDTRDPVGLLALRVFDEHRLICSECGLPECPLREDPFFDPSYSCPALIGLFKILDERLAELKPEEPKEGWVGFDLDGTLATYEKWEGPDHIGEPVLAMVALVKMFLAKGVKVKILTARVAETDPNRFLARETINNWCLENIGQELEITSNKDYLMISSYDDRCKQVVTNTGVLVEDLLEKATKDLRNLSLSMDPTFLQAVYALLRSPPDGIKQ